MRWKRFRPSEFFPVLNAVAKEHGVGLRDLIGTTRLAHVVAARKDAVQRLRSLGMSRPQIAAAINRDRYKTENGGLAPNFEQMAKAIGVKSKSNVHRLLAGLEERGMVRRIANKSRAIEVTAFNAGTFFDTLNPTARYVIQSMAQREGVAPELVMREYLNEWADNLRRNPSEYLEKTRVSA